MIYFRGKNWLSLRVVAAYRPQSNSGPYLVYQKHLQYYANNNNIKDPISNFGNEICSMIVDWIDNGDQVVVMTDANEDTSKTKNENFRQKIESSGLHELLLSHHPHLKNSSRYPGSKTIDRILTHQLLI